MSLDVTESDLAAIVDRAKRVLEEDHEYCGPVAVLADTDIPKLVDEVRRQAKEIEHLRHALADVAEHDCEYGDGCPLFTPLNHFRCMPCKAREALL